MFFRAIRLAALGASVCLLSACGSLVVGSLSYAPGADAVLASYPLTGDTAWMHDPSLMRQGNTYYVFTSDFPAPTAAGYLPIHCSADKIAWTACGAVFQRMPAWIAAPVPGATCLWAPDISYFNGLYHLYYAASTAGSQQSAIGLATNATLDPSDQAYRWVDRGPVLASRPGDDFNAIDPNILVDSDGSVWLTYGSYWSGIKQRQIDPATGMLATTDTKRYDLATRPGVPDDAIEGASLVRHGAYYYLFVSVDHCCDASAATDDYKQAVGRSASPHGPFVDTQGTPMMNGGGTVIIDGSGGWNAPGGGTAQVDATSGESVIAFHALKMSEQGAPHLWVKSLSWQNDWPAVQ